MKKVSVQVLAYEHEKCIERCLNSILDQNFLNYEITVGIDKSLDRTKELVSKIAKTSKVPINIIDHKIRVGAFNNFIEINRSCQGKYIAICDGDDYWTDRNKLEKQFTFMEKNSNLIASFHDSYLVNSNNDILAKLPIEKHRSKSYSQSYLIENESFMPSSSIMFKNIGLENFFYIFNGLDNIVDLPLVIYLLEFGEIGYIEQNMSNYVQASNLSAFTSKDVSFRDIEGLKMFDLINTYTKFRYNKVILLKKTRNLVNIFLFHITKGEISIARTTLKVLESYDFRCINLEKRIYLYVLFLFRKLFGIRASHLIFKVLIRLKRLNYE